MASSGGGGRECVLEKAHGVLTSESVACDEPEERGHGRSCCLDCVGCARLFGLAGLFHPAVLVDAENGGQPPSGSLVQAVRWASEVRGLVCRRSSHLRVARCFRLCSLSLVVDWGLEPCQWPAILFIASRAVSPPRVLSSGP
jgi:hypothetical protein